MLLSVAIRQRIINLSSLQKIKLKELSRRSNVSYPTIINFMSGKGSTLKISTLYNLCLGLGVDLVDFFDSPLFLDVLDEDDKDTEIK